MAATHNKYEIGYATSQVKHHEWRTAENSAAYLLPHFQLLATTNPTLKLLDVGAGPGTISASLAKYIPEGHVLATDISDEILTRASDYAASQGVKNISFQKADVFNLPFGDGSFDVTHAHQVLCHLDDPVAAVKELVRVTKVGGIVALRESDMQMWCIWPERAPLLAFHDVNVKTLIKDGGQDKGGRRLVSWVLEAGVRRGDIKASFGTWCFSERGDKEAWSIAFAERARKGNMREKAVKMGIATGEEMDGMAEAWEEWARMDESTLGIMNGEVIVTKR